MDEFEIIRRYFDRSAEHNRVIVGIGDDGAVLKTDVGRELVVVVDTMVSGIHFPESLEPADIGYRAVAVNLSDIAAMGATPVWMTLALTLAAADPDWLDDFARGLFEAAGEFGVALVGGDTTRGSDIVVTVQLGGDVDAGCALTRHGARRGDGIYISGTPGDAAAGLSILHGDAPRSETADYLVRRFARPQARVAVGQTIATFASAAIDLSDGLYTDLGKLLAAGKVSGHIDLDALPLSRQILAVLGQDDALQFALSGGDDYELCFTASDEDVDRRQVGGVPLTRIGTVGEGAGITCTRHGVAYDYHDEGYRHFHA